jgi:hypothetical protein
VVERIFGIVKKRWHILICPPNFPMQCQAQIPAALAALHNFIHIHDEEDVEDLNAEVEHDAQRYHSRADPVCDIYKAYGFLGSGPSRPAEQRAVMEHQNHIAQQMWDDYQEQVRRQEINGFESRV